MNYTRWLLALLLLPFAAVGWVVGLSLYPFLVGAAVALDMADEFFDDDEGFFDA